MKTVRRHLDTLLVGLGRSGVLGLIHLVGDGTEGTGGTVGDGAVGGVALGLLLVGLLGCLSGVALDGLGDVVGGVGDGVAEQQNQSKVSPKFEMRAWVTYEIWPTMPSFGLSAFGADILMGC